MEERFTYDWLNRLTGVIENGGPLGVFAVLDSHIQPMGKGMYYVHPDHLGSWTTVTSTFLSVDNYVQDPSYTQNFNRYAYCLNNPLKYSRLFSGHASYWLSQLQDNFALRVRMETHAYDFVNDYFV